MQRTNHLRSIMYEVKLLENEMVEIMNAVGVERYVVVVFFLACQLLTADTLF